MRTYRIIHENHPMPLERRVFGEAELLAAVERGDLFQPLVLRDVDQPRVIYAVHQGEIKLLGKINPRDFQEHLKSLETGVPIYRALPAHRTHKWKKPVPD